ncbi:WYL domain-containing protein [Rapidithrix thailandica]|uniref:WYL domain-containing protein n=1 Tax=Rapidithrix thailandica TaxID=413964 RepID=A0AAW9RT54_9BACT
MPVNRNALIRYKTIDACLRNRYKRWTLDMLIDTVSDALYEYEGIDKGISRRTIQADIQMMRSDKLGYNAPIVVVERKYYTYEDPNYSITNIPLSDQDLHRMNEAVEVLKQFKGFSHFNKLNEVVQKLEDHVYAASHKQRPVIDFEKNEDLKGLEHLDTIYHAITQKMTLDISYQSFKAKAANRFFFHAWWLKEFKNRWFVVGVRGNKQDITTLALDRIVEVKATEEVPCRENNSLHPEDYYKEVIGVTVSQTRPANVRIWISKQHAPYVETKPLHSSQELIERTEEGIVVQIKVQLNFELEKEIMGFGEGMKVLAPERLRKRIKYKMLMAAQLYEEVEEEQKEAAPEVQED